MAETNLSTSSSLAIDILPLVIKDELLTIADRDTVFYDLADKVSLPTGEGRTVQFTRYERLPLPRRPLVEGVTPDGTPLTASAVQCVVDQWGDVAKVTDVGLMTVKHPVLKIIQERLGTQFSELVDREIIKSLMATTNVFFPNGRTARSSLVAGDVVAGDLIRTINANLKQAGAPHYDKGKYMGVVDPFVSADIQKDTLFTQAASYSNIMALYNAEIGTWLGIRWKESNGLPIISKITLNTAPAASTGTTGGFADSTVVKVVVTKLDDQTGFETGVSAVTSVTCTTGSQFVTVLLDTALDATGTYNIYASLESGSVATLQRTVNHVVGATDTVIFRKSGTPSTNEYVVQATGPAAPTAPPSTGNVHISFIMGKGFFGCTELGRMQTTLTPPVASDSDPLVQRRKAGWKHLFKAVVKDTTRGYRLETVSAYN